MAGHSLGTQQQRCWCELRMLLSKHANNQTEAPADAVRMDSYVCIRRHGRVSDTLAGLERHMGSKPNQEQLSRASADYFGFGE